MWFTLRTHAAVIWNNEVDEKKTQEGVHQAVSQQTFGGAPHGRLQRQGTQTSVQHNMNEARNVDIRESQLYKRILGQSLKQVGLSHREEGTWHGSVSEVPPTNGSAQPSLSQTPQTPHLVPPKSSGGESSRSEFRIPGLSEAENSSLVREVAEMAATAATIAARDSLKAPRKTSLAAKTAALRASAVQEDVFPGVEAQLAEGGGHDAPNWSRTKSSVILCGATVLYALIAEILVNTVDVVLANVAIDEKFLGITLFALVPNTTEFLVISLTLFHG